MVFRLDLTYSENEYILDMNYISSSSSRYDPCPRKYEIKDKISMLKSFFSDELKVNITTDVITLRSISIKNKEK